MPIPPPTAIVTAILTPVRNATAPKRQSFPTRCASCSRLADVPRAEDPDLGVFVAQLERELAAAGTRSSGRCSTGARAGSFAFSSLRARHEERRGGLIPMSLRPFLVPAGLIGALASKAPLVVTAHGQDVRNIGAKPGLRTLTRWTIKRAGAVIAVSGFSGPRAGDETATGARQDQRDRLRCRSRALPAARPSRRPGRARLGRREPALSLRRLADRAEECRAPGTSLFPSREGLAGLSR